MRVDEVAGDSCQALAVGAWRMSGMSCSGTDGEPSRWAWGLGHLLATPRLVATASRFLLVRCYDVRTAGAYTRPHFSST
jgi:hypothetical protein